MKKIALLVLLCALQACSSSEPAPEVAPLPHPDDAAAAAAEGGTTSESAAAAAPAPDANLSTDPFLAPDAATNSAVAPAESSAADSLLATPVESSAKPAETAEALPSPTPPAEPVPAPRVSIDHEVKPTSPMPVAKADPRKKDSYEAYKEYKQKEASRQELQDSYDDRAMFPHEDGGFHISFDYMRNAYNNLAVNTLTSPLTSTSQGGQVSFMYFPLRSLSYGRLGAGVTGGSFWTKYEYPSESTANKVDTATSRSIYTYGVRAMYEFDYWLGQIVVPFVSYDFNKVRSRGFERRGSRVLVNASALDYQCYGLGASLNLNRLEPVSASRGLATLGVRKTYLTYTFLKGASGSNSGTGTHGLGLRFEF